MAYLVETGVYEPAITKVNDTLNDESNLQLANRTKYLNNALNNLTNYLGTIKDTQDLKIEELSNRINSIKAVIGGGGSSSSISTSDEVVRAVNKLLEDVQNLQNAVDNHTHNYAGASIPGGPALQVDIVDDQINALSLIGTDAMNTSKIKRNTNVFVEENGLHADVFYGNLQGEASEAVKLSHSPKISLIGDVLGNVEFTGEKNVSINTTLKEQNVTPGQYGETSNKQLDVDGNIIIPNITVGSDGVITGIQNQVISLPEGLNITGVISTHQDSRKLFLVGADEQSDSARTYSQQGVYEYNNKLYSNNDEVVTLNQIQNLENKTINGHYIDEAASHKVDTTIGGTENSSALITSDAVYKHVHNYAGAGYPSGPASKVEIQNGDNTHRNLVTHEYNQLYDSQVKASLRELLAPNIIATDNMTIPGGKIWIENVDSDSSGGKISPAEFLNPDEYLQRLTFENVQQGVKASPGKLMSYKANGFVLADNNSRELTKNLAIITSNPNDENQAKMLLCGSYNLGTDYYDGLDVYVGQQGGMLFGEPSGTDFIKRKIGYVKEDNLIFMPEDFGASDRLDQLEQNLDAYVHPDQNFTWELDAYGNYQPKDIISGDHMWNVDSQGDIMPGEHNYPNPYWEWEPEFPENIWACATAITFKGKIYLSTKNSKMEIITRNSPPRKIYYYIFENILPEDVRYWKKKNSPQWRHDSYAWYKTSTPTYIGNVPEWNEPIKPYWKKDSFMWTKTKSNKKWTQTPMWDDMSAPYWGYSTDAAWNPYSYYSSYEEVNMWENPNAPYWMYESFDEWGNLTANLLEINGEYYSIDDLLVYQQPFYIKENYSVAVFVDVENDLEVDDVIIVRNI